VLDPTQVLAKQCLTLSSVSSGERYVFENDLAVDDGSGGELDAANGVPRRAKSPLARLRYIDITQRREKFLLVA
jgi:hypothetical protein